MISCFRISSKASLRTILPLPTMASARWLKTMQDKEYPVVKKTPLAKRFGFQKTILEIHACPVAPADGTGVNPV